MNDFKIFSTELSQLHTILEWVSTEAKSLGFSLRQIRELECGLEEVIVNIIHHGYKNHSGRIEISLLYLSDRLEVTIKDKGPPFNPTKHAVIKEELQKSLEERKEGGLGIHFLRHFIDEMHYQRWENYNILKLAKYKIKKPPLV